MRNLCKSLTLDCCKNITFFIMCNVYACFFGRKALKICVLANMDIAVCGCRIPVRLFGLSVCVYGKMLSHLKKYFFSRLKNFPQEIENTREIIENMSEIIQNMSDIFFAIYTPADSQVLGR